MANNRIAAQLAGALLVGLLLIAFSDNFYFSGISVKRKRH